MTWSVQYFFSNMNDEDDSCTHTYIWPERAVPHPSTYLSPT